MIINANEERQAMGENDPIRVKPLVLGIIKCQKTVM
jgi:hypothetical protein